MPTMTHTIDVTCSPQQMFDYISQPWRWHEWHPNSTGASQASRPLSVGDGFVEDFAIRPVPFLPLTLHRKLHYRVISARPPEAWEIKATMEGGGADIHFRYRFEPTAAGARFTRTLDYTIHGPMKLLAPLIRRANTRNSELAMAALKQRADALAVRPG